MKNLKNKTRILTYLICFCAFVLVNISCETNEELEEIIETAKKENTLAKTAAKKGIKTGRTKIKRRRNGLYRASIGFPNSKKDKAVPLGAVLMEVESGSEGKTYTLDYFITDNKIDYYTFGDIKLDDTEIENQEVTVNITLLNAKKEPIYIRNGDICVISGLAKANIKGGRTRVKKRPNGLYKLTAEIEDPENEVAIVEYSIGDLCGTTTHFKTLPKKDNTIAAKFNFEKEACSTQLNVFASLKDLFGDEIGSSKEEVEVCIPQKASGKLNFSNTSPNIYTATIALKNDALDDIASFTIEIKKTEGLIGETKSYELKYVKTEKGIKYFSFEGIAFENTKVINKKGEMSTEVTVNVKAKSKGGSKWDCTYTGLRLRCVCNCNSD